MTDLSNIVATERTIEIKHPRTGQPVGLSVTLLPDSHPSVRAASRKAMNERLASRSKATAERIEGTRLDMLVAAVGGWEWAGDLNFRGQKPEARPEAVREVLTSLSWIADQIDSELGDQTEFFRSTEEASG